MSKSRVCYASVLGDCGGRLTFEHLVRIKIVVRRTVNNGHIDLQQGLPNRIRFLDETNLHCPNTRLGSIKLPHKVVLIGRCGTGSQTKLQLFNPDGARRIESVLISATGDGAAITGTSGGGSSSGLGDECAIMQVTLAQG